MATTRKFSQLREKMSPESQARAAAQAQAMLVEMDLRELRKSRNATQVEVAAALHVEQAAVSKMERRNDMYLSTLQGYIEALGGELKLVASFPDGDIRIQSLETER